MNPSSASVHEALNNAVINELARPTKAGWHAWPLLLSPARVARGLARIRAVGLVDPCPNLWQLELGVMRMWHRTFFRSDSIGTSTTFSPRKTLRARLLHNRMLRGPFLFAEQAIAPWDMTGLYSSPERITRHLLGAHHDCEQCVYDFSLLSLHPGALERLRARVQAVVDGTDPRSEWLRDLCVYERYHEELLGYLDAWLAGTLTLDDTLATDPDITFEAWLAWCAAQPDTPEKWWAARQAGTFTFFPDTPDTPVDTFDTDPRVRDLLSLDQAGLKATFERGTPLPLADLRPGQYRGVSLGLPKFAERLSWKTFLKTIEVDADGRLHGCNVRLVQDHDAQDPLALAPRPMQKLGSPYRFGFYGIGTTPAGKPGAGGALIDYRLGTNPLLDPVSRMVDPLVCLTPGDPTVLISRSYAVVGSAWVPTPTWFVLQHIPADGGTSVAL
jgi:hypothetical protein